MEPAAGRRIDGTWNIALDTALLLLPCQLRVGNGNTSQKPLRIRMEGIFIYLICLAHFHQLSQIHTDAIKDNLIPPKLTPAQATYTYANEADMLNVVLSGKTAKQWKGENPSEKGNTQDAATLNQLFVLANLESYNPVLINQEKSQKERMELLRQLTVCQLQTLATASLNNLPKLEV